MTHDINEQSRVEECISVLWSSICDDLPVSKPGTALFKCHYSNVFQKPKTKTTLGREPSTHVWVMKNEEIMKHKYFIIRFIYPISQLPIWTKMMISTSYWSVSKYSNISFVIEIILPYFQSVSATVDLGLYGPRYPLSPKRRLNLITHLLTVDLYFRNFHQHPWFWWLE